MFDAEGIAASDFADFARPYAVLSRNCEKGGKIFGGERDDGAGAAFAEEGEFGGGRVVEIDGGAENGRGKPRPYGAETRLCERDGEAAIGKVVSGFEDAFGGERYEAVDEAFFGC